jgi:hypothetical protein
MSAEVMTNFIPRVLGSMSIRPGWKYLGATKGNNAAKLIPFVFAVDDTAVLEITSSYMRVWRIDALITRIAVGTGITNGAFNTDLTGWTDNDEAGAASTWATGGYLQLLGDGTNAAIRDQEITVAGGDQNDEHALTIVISRGPVLLRVGSTVGSENYIAEMSLGTGTHSLAFTPAGNFWIRFFSRLSRPVLVDSVSIEAAGVMAITAPWSAANLDNLRWDQSGDIVFVACKDVQPHMIQRWSANSWSVVLYEPEDGPFLVENTSNITITPSAITGSITLTASKAIFRSTNVGSLYSLTSEGQTVTANISSQNTFTDAIRITGVDSSRVFTIILSGTWAATVTLQRSLESEDGPWEDVSGQSFSLNTTETFDDGLDNQIAWYRIGVKTGQYTSGTVVATLDYALGAITGVVRVTAYTSGLVLTADVLKDLGGTEATEIWAEGAWSTRRGFPTAVALHEARLWWGGKSKVWGSVTDAFDSFDPDFEGDAGPISRSLGVGPTDRINWLFSSGRLLIGADINEYAARSSSLDEPLTPTQFNIKATSNQGSAAVMPVRIDSVPAFVNRTGMKVYQNELTGQTLDYTATDLCQMVPEIGNPRIVRLAVQRQPDTRIHAVRSDGTVALAVFDKAEDVLGWCEIETDGDVEDAIVLPAQPGVTDDYVYYVVKRDIDGAEVRYLEKWAQASDTIGGLGLGGGSPYLEFDAYDVELTGSDSSGAGVEFYFSVPEQAIFIAVRGATAATCNIWKHPVPNFPAGSSLIDPGADRINEPQNAGAMSKDGTRYWLSGDNIFPDPVRCVTLATGVVTTFDAAVNRVVMAARDEFIIVYEGGRTYAFIPNFSTMTLGAFTREWIVNQGLGPITYQGVWSADGWMWTANMQYSQGRYHLLRVNPDIAAYREDAFPPPAPTHLLQNRTPPCYDSTRNRILVYFSDPTIVAPIPGGIWAYSGWSQSANDAGTWTRLTTDTDQNFILHAMYYDSGSDIIFAITNQSWDESNPGAYRYRASDGAIIDFVSLLPSLGDIPYNLFINRFIYYSHTAAGDYGFVYASPSGPDPDYVLRINYNGPTIAEGPFGDNLLPGGTTGRLHDLADSYINYDGVAITTVTGLSHLEGEEVVVWADGIDLGTDANYAQTFTVSGGQITLPAATSLITVGLPYTAQFKSSKLGLQTQAEVLFGKDKRITELALVLANTHAKGIRFGPDFTNLDDRAGREEWADVDPDQIDTDYDREPLQFPSTWTPDLRICLQAQAPRPCTVLAVQVTIEI